MDDPKSTDTAGGFTLSEKGKTFLKPSLTPGWNMQILRRKWQNTANKIQGGQNVHNLTR